MNTDRPVKIPEIPGKIVLTEVNGAHYVKYLVGQEYDRIRKFSIPRRVVIGTRIENMPTMMMPNENYMKYFTAEGKELEKKTGEEEQDYGERRAIYKQYRDFFNELFYEMKSQSRGRLEAIVPGYQAAAVNKVLEPLRGLMKDERYGELLEMIPMPETDEEGKTVGGMSYGNAMILLCQYKTALGRYYSEKL